MGDYYDFSDDSDASDVVNRRKRMQERGLNNSPEKATIDNIDSAMKELKVKHGRVLNEGRHRTNKTNSMSPIRGKLRPKSAPLNRPKIPDNSALPYDDGYEQRPITSRVINHKTKKNAENVLLRETVKFTEKIQEWGKRKPAKEHMEANRENYNRANSARATLKTHKKKNDNLHLKHNDKHDNLIEFIEHEMREEEIKCLLSKKGDEKTKSYNRIRSYNSKEQEQKKELEITVYNEAMDRIQEIFHSLHQANSLCHSVESCIRYGIHHNKTEKDIEFWDSARLLIKAHKKKRLEQLQEEATHGILRAADMDNMGNTNELLLKHHRKLLLSGCGKRLYNLYIDELRYNKDQLHHIQELDHTDHHHTNTEVSHVVRCMSWDKFMKNIVPELKKKAPGLEKPSGDAALGDEESKENDKSEYGMGHDEMDNADYNYYAKHIMNNEGTKSATAPRETELILLSLAEQFLFARKDVERQLHEIKENRGWN